MAKARKFLVWGLAGFVAFCGLGGTWFYNGFGQPEAEYRRELAIGTKIGLPSDPDEYQRKVAPDQNSASYYLEAISLWAAFEKQNKDSARNVQSGTLTVDYIASQAKKDLQPLDALFAKLDEAAAIPSLCFDKRYANGYMELYPELAPLKAFVRIRCLKAILLAKEGKFDASFDELNRAAAIPRQLGEDNPTLIHGLVQISLRSIIMRNVEQILSQQKRTPKASAQVTILLDKMGPVPNLKQIIRGQYASAIGSLALFEAPSGRTELVKSYTGNPDGSQRPSPLGFKMGLPRLRYETETKLVQELRRGYDEIPEDSSDVQKFLAATKAADRRQRIRSQLDNELMELFYIDYSTTAQAIIRSVAESRLLTILAASLGNPTGVKVPTGLEDPFSNKPFLTSTKGDNFRIWSVGPDGKDNGGKAIRPFGEGNTSDEFDIVMTYPYVEIVRSNRGPRFMPRMRPGVRPGIRADL